MSSPYINHFISPDTIVPGYGNPQALNRYSYTLNNPLRYTDPTGHMASDDHGGGKCDSKCLKSLSSLKSGRNFRRLVGISPSVGSTGSTYGAQAQETTCGGCSLEPNLPQGSGAIPNGFGLGNDIAAWGINNSAANGQDIPVYANMTANPNGSVSVHSLTIDNRNTGAAIAVMSVHFNVSGDNVPCFLPNGCYRSAPYGYEVQPHTGSSINSTDTIVPGIGVITSPLSVQDVNLTPSGYPNNPTNTFNHSFEIVVTLGNSQTGDVFKPIALTINP